MEAKHIPGPAAEAIANADAHLNNAALQTYSALIEQHAEMLAALEAEEEWRCREADGAIDPSWNYEVMVGAKRRSAIAKAIGSAGEHTITYGYPSSILASRVGRSAEGAYTLSVGSKCDGYATYEEAVEAARKLTTTPSRWSMDHPLNARFLTQSGTGSAAC